MFEQLLKIVFTKIVIAMIVLPVPPTTIIGLAMIANPHTNKYLEPRMLKAMETTLGLAKQAIKWKLQKMTEAHAFRAAQYVNK